MTVRKKKAAKKNKPGSTRKRAKSTATTKKATGKTTKRTRTKAPKPENANTNENDPLGDTTESAAAEIPSSGDERDPIQAEAAKQYKRHDRRDGVFSCSVRSCMRGSRADGRASNVDDGRAWWVPACHDWFCDQEHADEYMRDRYG